MTTATLTEQELIEILRKHITLVQFAPDAALANPTEGTGHE